MTRIIGRQGREAEEEGDNNAEEDDNHGREQRDE